MTLATFVSLAKAYRALDALTARHMDSVLVGRAERVPQTHLRIVRVWLEELESGSGNDDELADDVSGALDYVRRILRGTGGRSEH